MRIRRRGRDRYAADYSTFRDLREPRHGTAVQGTINVDIRDSEPDWRRSSPRGARGAPNVIYIVLDDVGFSAMSCYGGPIETPNIDRSSRRRALHAVPHDRAVLPDPLVPAHRPEPHAQQHGLHHRGGDRLSERQRHDPAGERDAVGDPRRARLEHLHGRQVAPLPDRRDEPRLDAAQLAERARASSAGTGSSAPRRTSGIPTSSTTTTRSISRPRPEEGYHLTDDLTDKALEFIRDAKAVAPDKPFFLYYAPGACHAPHHAPKEWIDKFKGRFDMGYEAMREQTLARQKKLGIVPADTELPPINPIGRRDAHRPRRQAVPDARLHPPVGLPERRREAAVRPDGRGLRRLPRARRPPHRPAARLPGGERPAREHDDRRRLRQRRERRGRPERLGQRDEVRQRHPRRPGAEPGDDRRARRHEDLQPLPDRLGDGVQHAVQDVEALRVQRRNVRPVHHLVAGRDQGARRDPRPVPPRDRPRADDPRRPRRRAAGDDQGAHADRRSTASACATASTTPSAESRAQDAVLRDARLPLDLARRLEGRDHPSDISGLEPLQRRRLGALPHRRRPLGGPQPRRRAAGQAEGAGQHLVLRGRRERRVPAR